MSENGDYVGNFKKIGYEMDATTTFDYDDGIGDGDEAGTSKLAAIDDAWKATSKSALNECKKGETWNLKLEGSSSGNGLKWTASYSDDTNCEVLTPRFKDLSRGQ